MALSEEAKAVKPTQPSNSQKSEKREKPPTKVIIRRLPPTIDKETFLNQISPVPNYDYFYLVNGEALLGENSFSRAYINFVNANDVFDFKEKFDNYVFLDHRGNEYAAVVEFAAFQKIPKKRNKNRTDPKCNSIETDPVYLEFVENLNKPVELEDKPEYSYQFLTETKDSKETITPLLEFVKNRRVEKMRIREERREERKRKELERKNKIFEERKKKFLEKQSPKTYKPKQDESDPELKEEEPDKYLETSTSFRNKDRKFDDRKKDVKKTSPRKEYIEKREFKSRREFYKEPKYEQSKKEEIKFPKKVKKYSEKREERKIEAQKSELKKVEKEECSKNLKEEGEVLEKTGDIEDKTDDKSVVESEKETKEGVKENEKNDVEKEVEKDNESRDNDKERKDNEKISPRKSASDKESRKERIRNKDRPTIAIYRPGMLSKRKLGAGDAQGDGNRESNSKDNTKGK